MILTGASSSVWALMVNTDKQRGCFHLCLQSGERADVFASLEEQALWWVKGVSVALLNVEMQKSSIKSNKHIALTRTTKNEDCEADKPATPPHTSLPAISQARGAGNGPGSDGLLDVAVMKWKRLQVCV
jgi:hypothetical protein